MSEPDKDAAAFPYTIELGPRQGFVVPKGVMHRTRAPERAIVIMIETKGVVPTGS